MSYDKQKEINEQSMPVSGHFIHSKMYRKCLTALETGAWSICSAAICCPGF